MNIACFISLIPNSFLILVAYAFFGFAPCYDGCDELADFLFVIYVIPFCIPLIVSVFALWTWYSKGILKRYHPIILGIYCAALIILGIFFSVYDPADAFIHGLLVPLGIMVGLPTIYAIIKRPVFE